MIKKIWFFTDPQRPKALGMIRVSWISWQLSQLCSSPCCQPHSQTTRGVTHSLIPTYGERSWLLNPMSHYQSWALSWLHQLELIPVVRKICGCWLVPVCIIWADHLWDWGWVTTQKAWPLHNEEGLKCWERWDDGGPYLYSLATWEAEIGGISVQRQPKQIVHETPISKQPE
jgi:hypothetical protein